MAGENAVPIIIIKRVKKGGHEGHHGGAWKVAYADFVTAMMAFFLLLWLLNSTTEEQMAGIADYFSPTTSSQSSSGAGGVLGGTSMLSPGAMATPKTAPGVTVSLLPLDQKEEPDTEGKPAEKPKDNDAATDPSEQALEDLRAKLEQQEFEKAKAALRAAIDTSPDLREFSKNLYIDMTPEGMRIQIVDAEQRSMFPSGGSTMYDYTEQLLQKVAQTIAKLPNDIAVIGHTDATPFRSHGGYTNWELSTDRANASRRALVGAGLPDWRIVRVSGKAGNDPFVKDDPYSAQNRRISILLLRQSEKKKAP
ncbi:MAG: flagellar motor protein MotB [Alphaproteobacteria bacterium]